MMRVLMLVVGVVSAAIVLSALWLDEGEVVALITSDAQGNSHDTQLWTVELAGVQYLRASTSDAEWLQRLRDRPLVEIESEDSSVQYLALPQDDAALRGRVNAAMAKKYGFADQIWGAMGDRSLSIPIRLDPVEDSVLADEDSS